MNIRCIRCKGRDPRSNCGRSFCPIYAKAEAMFTVEKMQLKQDFFGASPAPFVGHHGYPNLNVGILSPPEKKEDIDEYDAPRHWAERNYQIPKIIGFRSSLINSRFKSHIKEQSPMLNLSQEVGMSSRPVDVEISLKEKPHFSLNTDAFLAPTGPNAIIRKARLAENPKVDTRVDKAVSDTSLHAKDAITYLYKKDFDENFLTKLLSVGNLGIGRSRKLVPTRWAITATDDMIGKDILDSVRAYPESDYLAYYGGYLGNFFLILFFSKNWSYELFETYMPHAEWNQTENIQFTTDYEGYGSRTSYAENCAGGYYAARLPILEKLKDMKRQSAVLALRFITGEYAVPLGVFVVREAVRKALHSRPIGFSGHDLMLKYAKALVQKKFGYNINNLLVYSKLLKRVIYQTRLSQF